MQGEEKLILNVAVECIKDNIGTRNFEYWFTNFIFNVMFIFNFMFTEVKCRWELSLTLLSYGVK